VADGQAAYGDGSGQENDDAIGSSVTPGRDNFIYVRVTNRGAVAATNVTARIYWAPPATLALPNTWQEIGTTGPMTVPAGGELTVTAPLRWVQAQLPPVGHYCFVGLVGCDGDPAPDPVNIPVWLTSWEVFLNLIKMNNNVTWRNFDVIAVAAPGGSSAPAAPENLEFFAPGAYDRERPFALEVLAQLPEGATLWLEGPATLIDGLHAHSPFVRRAADRAAIPLAPHGRRRLGPGLFPARSKNPMKLVLELPAQARRHGGEVAVRQLYEDFEVGRVTFRLKPERRD
jgi:hypothetical protein